MVMNIRGTSERRAAWKTHFNEQVLLNITRSQFTRFYRVAQLHLGDVYILLSSFENWRGKGNKFDSWYKSGILSARMTLLTAPNL